MGYGVHGRIVAEFGIEIVTIRYRVIEYRFD